MRHIYSLCLIGLVLLSSCGNGKDGNDGKNLSKQVPNKFSIEPNQQIFEFADQRNADSILPFLDDASYLVRSQAAMALGSVQDPKAGPQLMTMLEDENFAVCGQAAWAIGQLGDSTFTENLLSIMLAKPVKEMPVFGEALGKAGRIETLNEMLQLEAAGGYPKGAENAFMQAIYRAGLRKIILPGAEDFAWKTLLSENTEARVYAAAFLGRIRSLPDIQDFDRLTSQFGEDQSIDVQIQLVKVFRRCKETECTERLQAIAGDRKGNILVRANAFAAAQNTHNIDQAAFEACKESNSQVAVAAAEYLLTRSEVPAANLIDLAAQIQLWRPRALVLRAATKNAYLKSESDLLKEAIVKIDERLASAKLYEKGYLLAALSEAVSEQPRVIEAVLKKEKISSTLAAEAIASAYGQNPRRDWQEPIQIMQRFVETGDPAIVAIAADFFGNGNAMMQAQVKSTTFLEDALAKLKLPEEIETYNGVEKAIAQIQKRAPNPKTLEFQNPIDWKLVKSIPQNQTASITTNKGKIVFQLMVEVAPGTVANFVKLVQEGFYNGKSFHRIVPAFVAQGGCPRGDGYGSTPDVIRSEWPQAHYTTGMVGMASAGKDTESCQWFITHCATPHLDGRYTIFAKVIAGMDVVQQIEIGDLIESVTLDGFVGGV